MNKRAKHEYAMDAVSDRFVATNIKAEQLQVTTAKCVLSLIKVIRTCVYMYVCMFVSVSTTAD